MDLKTDIAPALNYCAKLCHETGGVMHYQRGKVEGLVRFIMLNTGQDLESVVLEWGFGTSGLDRVYEQPMLVENQSRIVSSLLEGRVCDEENVLMIIVIRNTY